MDKSGATLVLSTASGYFNPSMGTQSLWSIVITTGWSGAMLLLSRHLALRNDTLAAVAAADKAPEVTVKATATTDTAVTITTATTATTTAATTTTLVDGKLTADNVEISQEEMKETETVSTIGHVLSGSKLSSLSLNVDNSSRDSNVTTTASTGGTTDDQRRDRLNSDGDSIDEGAEISPMSPATLWETTTKIVGGQSITKEIDVRRTNSGVDSELDYGEVLVIHTSNDEQEQEQSGTWTPVDAQLDASPSLGGSPNPMTKDGIRRRKNNELVELGPRRPSRTFEDIYDIATVTSNERGFHDKLTTMSSRGSDGQLNSSPNTPNKRKNTVVEESWLSKWAGTLTGMDPGRKTAGRPLLLRVGSTNFSVLDVDPKMDNSSKKIPVIKNTSLFRVGSTNMNFANLERLVSGVFDTSSTKEKK